MSGTLSDMKSQEPEEIEVSPSELGSSFCGLRLCVREAQKQMQLSLSERGQLTPVQACQTPAGLELFDGLKRWRAAQDLSWPKLRVEVHTLESAGAKVRLLLCNATTGLTDIEEAWVVRSLYREDQLDQPQIARMLGHDKSWVSRRLTLAEELSDELTANVRLGLISATAAVELARLQRCNQDAAAKVVIRRGLTTRQTSGLVEKLLSSPPEEITKQLEKIGLRVVPAVPKGGARRRTPGEQLVADAWAMKRLSTRLHARLLERSLESLGAEPCTAVRGELVELRGALNALTKTLDLRLST
jgi:ParB/RepB/Spo0J family partition protein